MTDTRRITKRVTVSRRREGGKARPIVVSIEPGDILGFRLSGTRGTYRISIEGAYEFAVLNHSRRVEKRAKELGKSMPIRTARARARKELQQDLKS